MKRRIDAKSIGVAVVLGIFSGMYIFNPIIKDMNANVSKVKLNQKRNVDKVDDSECSSLK